MNNFCAKHNQFYSDYCVYCGPPLRGVSTANTLTCVHDYWLTAGGEYCEKCGEKKYNLVK